MIEVGRRFVAYILLLLFLVSTATAESTSSSWEQENSFVWEYDFEFGYISTAPLYHDEKIFVRTSGISEPAVTALGVDGEFHWKHSNPTTMSNDMSPLVYVQAGQGSCGSWPEMILVGWTDGTIDAILPNNGTVHWSTQTEVAGWGITGAFSVEEDSVVVPTRNGVGQYCLADGHQQWWVETDLGWRNGVTVSSQGYYVGSEIGNLWKVSPQGTAMLLSSFEGKIRHAPIQTDAGLLVHVQYASSSTVTLVHPEDGSILQEFPSGPSPGIPSLQDGKITTGDSSSLNMFSCNNTCQLTDTFSHHTNGEIGVSPQGWIVVPTNIPDSNWGVVSYDENQTASYSQIDVGIYGYGTSSPLWFSLDGINYTVFGNDQSLLRVFREVGTQNSQPPLQPAAGGDLVENEDEFDWSEQGLLFVMYVFLSMSAIFFLNRNKDLFLKSSSALMLMIALLILPELSSEWSKAFDEQFPQNSFDEDWNDEWPDAWLDTQIVTFEIEGQTFTVGGLTGHEDVLSLTQAAANELEFEFTAEESELGWYVSSIDDRQGQGWNYFVDGKKEVVSADKSPTELDTRVRWVLL